MVLFESLAGQRPSGDSSLLALLENAVEEREPPRLAANIAPDAARKRGTTEAALRASLSHDDLETIVGRCLQVRPQDRYASVSALADDIERYLNGLPILARPQTTLYLLEKFVRRNKARVTAAALLITALIAALFYGLTEQRRALAHQQRAIEESARAARTQAFMNELFRMANSNFSGKQVTSLSDFLALGIKMAPLLATGKQQLAEVECSLAISMHDSGDLKGSTPVFRKGRRRRPCCRGREYGNRCSVLSDRTLLR